MKSNEGYISVADAARILKVTVARIHQFINSPCLGCGRSAIESEINDEGEIEYFDVSVFNESGCQECNYTGFRLPTYGRFGTAEQSPHRLKLSDVEKLKGRKGGFPKGKTRKSRAVR